METKREFQSISKLNLTKDAMPKRATKHSAGYDFTFPFAEPFVIEPHSIGFVPTGIKVKLPEDEYLALYNRSSNPKKKGLVLVNGVGVVDADYYNNEDNEGHIMFAFYNILNTPVTINQGEKIGQGVFTKYEIVDGDSLSEGEQRSGGFGSTSK